MLVQERLCPKRQHGGIDGRGWSSLDFEKSGWYAINYTGAPTRPPSNIACNKCEICGYGWATAGMIAKHEANIYARLKTKMSISYLDEFSGGSCMLLNNKQLLTPGNVVLQRA